MVLVGKVNKDIVLRLNRHGQPAVGLCGDDGPLFRVARQAAPGGEDIGFVGRIERVDVDVLHHIAQDYIPVIASVGADREGHSYNVNADEAAGRRRPRARAPTRSSSSPTSPAGCATRRPGVGRLARPAPTRSTTRSPSVAGGMRPKLQACLDAIHGGVTLAHIVDGRVAALAAARAVHRRRHRHEDPGRALESS